MSVRRSWRTVGWLAALALVGASGLAAAPGDGKGEVGRAPALPVIGDAVELSHAPALAEVDWSGDRGVLRETIERGGASFLKPHFAGLSLRPGDRLRVLTADGRLVETLEGRGWRDRGTFWGLSVPGDRLVLELELKAPYDALPFTIDRMMVGRADGPLAAPIASPFALPDETKSICGPADFEDTICYDDDAPKWANIRASAGVMLLDGDPNSVLFCSGANVSPLGYVLTNNHCILDQAECDESEIVFGFRRTACNVGAAPATDWTSYRCADVLASSPFFVCEADETQLDFTLVAVEGDPTPVYGAVRIDAETLSSGEDVYIVQHPSGRPQEIAHGGGANFVVDGFNLRYYETLDTEPGSSGSPIFRASDHRMVGLHHCGECDAPEGNRGMPMSVIEPLISDFLCSQELGVSAAETPQAIEVTGNGDSVLDPGEIWSVTPRLRNRSCDLTASGLTARLVPAGGVTDVVLLDETVTFGDFGSGEVASALDPVRFRLGDSVACGGPIVFDLVDLSVTSGDPLPDLPAVYSDVVGVKPQTTLLAEDFVGGIPPSWTVVDGGTGSGPAATWTTDNPADRDTRLSTPPFAMVDSDELGQDQLMDEELITPAIDFSAFTGATLEMTHDFNWYELGFDEKGDVEARSSATGGAWVLVARYEDEDHAGFQRFDLSALAAGADDLQVRFRYHEARFEWWWAVDTVFLLGDNGFVCTASRLFA
ncbi:MAG: serine protease, partial [Acidobacteriota bacterium]